MMYSQGLERLIELIAVIHTRSTRAAQNALRGFDLTYPQFGVLLVLARQPGPNQAELAAILEIDTTTAMVICNGLEQKGLVMRERDARDRRANLLHLTDEGKRRVTEAYPAVERCYSFLPEVVGEADLVAVLPVLERVADRIKTEGEARK